MCHSRRLRWEERDERFERELRSLFQRESERPEPPTPVVEHDVDKEAAAEPPAEEVPATRA